MAKEEKEKPKGEAEGGEKKTAKPKKHLHSIRTEATVDHKGKSTGYISHHTYKAKATDHHTEPEKPMAVHDTAEEAGQHVQEQFGQQEGAAPQEEEAAAGPEARAGDAGPAAGM